MKMVGVEKESAEEVAKLNMQLESLMDKAPSDATGIFFIRKEKDGYKGLLKIRSIQEKFVAACSSPNLSDLTERIIKEARSQIEVWKRNRFSRRRLSFSS